MDKIEFISKCYLIENKDQNTEPRECDIFVDKDDNCDIPHFHIRDKYRQTGLCLFESNYVGHRGFINSELTPDEKADLDNFLRSKNVDHSNLTNWEYIVLIWVTMRGEHFNSCNIIDQPNYNIISHMIIKLKGGEYNG